MGCPSVRPSGRPQERAGNRQPRGMAITGPQGPDTESGVQVDSPPPTFDLRKSGLNCGNGEAQASASREIVAFRNLLRPVCGLGASSARIPAGQRGRRHCLPASVRKATRSGLRGSHFFASEPDRWRTQTAGLRRRGLSGWRGTAARVGRKPRLLRLLTRRVSSSRVARHRRRTPRARLTRIEGATDRLPKVR